MAIPDQSGNFTLRYHDLLSDNQREAIYSYRAFSSRVARDAWDGWEDEEEVEEQPLAATRTPIKEVGEPQSYQWDFEALHSLKISKTTGKVKIAQSTVQVDREAAQKEAYRRFREAHKEDSPGLPEEYYWHSYRFHEELEALVQQVILEKSEDDAFLEVIPSHEGKHARHLAQPIKVKTGFE